MTLNKSQAFTLLNMDLDGLLSHVRDQATSLSSRLHGETHWLRVTKVGLELAKYVPDCDLTVIFLFGLLHDTQRLKDGRDPQHGERAAHFVENLNNRYVSLSDDQLKMLMYACHCHEKGQVSDQSTVGICWDADRLNLWRVKIVPQARFLSTPTAKTWSMRWKALSTQFQRFTWHGLQQQYIALAKTRTQTL